MKDPLDNLWYVIKVQCNGLSIETLNTLEKETKDFIELLPQLPSIEIESISYPIDLAAFTLDALFPKSISTSIKRIMNALDDAICLRTNEKIFMEKLGESAYVILQGGLSGSLMVKVQDKIQKFISVLNLLQAKLSHATIIVGDENNYAKIQIHIIHGNFLYLSKILKKEIQNCENLRTLDAPSESKALLADGKSLLLFKDILEVERRKIIVAWYYQHLCDEIYKLDGLTSRIGLKPSDNQLQDFNQRVAKNAEEKPPNLLWVKYQAVSLLQDSLVSDASHREKLAKFDSLLMTHKSMFVNSRTYAILPMFVRKTPNGEIFLNKLLETTLLEPALQAWINQKN